MAEDPAYHTVLQALVDETEATRRKREVMAQAGGGGERGGARQVAFVQSNRSTAKITRQARRGVNERHQEFVNNYTLLKQLGAGQYGKVYLCVDSAAAGRVYAIKCVDKAKLRRKRLGLSDVELLREVEVMKKLRHRNLVSLVEVIDDSASNTLFMVQEFCELGCVMTEQEYNTPLQSEVARGA